MSLNILIVEDCDLVRKVIIRTLNLSKIPITNVYEAADGLEALRLVQSNWIDLILVDLNMPVMDGVEMIDRLHADGLLKTIPVVVVSTEGSETRIEELRRKGVTAYVRKPFTPEEIRDIVLDVLGRPDTEDHLRLLGDTFCSVVESFALMLGEAQEDPAARMPMDDGWVQAKVSFRGQLCGNLTVAAPQALLCEIAGNVLGVDPDDDQAAEAAPDALKELVNLVAGRLLTEVADVVAVHDLTAPVFGGVDADEWARPAVAGVTPAWFQVEDHPVALMLEMRRAIA